MATQNEPPKRRQGTSPRPLPQPRPEGFLEVVALASGLLRGEGRASPRQVSRKLGS